MRPICDAASRCTGGTIIEAGRISGSRKTQGRARSPAGLTTIRWTDHCDSGSRRSSSPLGTAGRVSARPAARVGQRYRLATHCTQIVSSTDTDRGKPSIERDLTVRNPGTSAVPALPSPRTPTQFWRTTPSPAENSALDCCRYALGRAPAARRCLCAAACLSANDQGGPPPHILRDMKKRKEAT